MITAAEWVRVQSVEWQLLAFYWNEPDHGGHFAALEVPDLFAEELRRCFRAVRGA